MDFLEKLQNQPSYKKKIIIWCVIVVIGALLLILWGTSFQKKLKSFQGKGFIENFNMPDLKAKMDSIPAMQIPGVDEKSVKKVEEEINNAEKEQNQQDNQKP